MLKKIYKHCFPKRVYIFHHYVTLKGLEADMQTKSTNNQAQIKTKMTPQ
ncbi:MAG: hypothetical protein WA395_08305 [Nitrososphaeraceae archaeon]